MTDAKNIPIGPETEGGSYEINDIGPEDVMLPCGLVHCHPAIAQTTITADSGDGSDLFLMVITAAKFNGTLLGTLSPMTPNEARAFAASLLRGADECDQKRGLN